MSADDLAKKLGAVFSRFGQGKDQKIKPADVEKIIAKLRDRRDDLKQHAVAAAGTRDAARMARKLASVEQLLARAQWLLAEIDLAQGDSPAAD
ncbi:hypothetical protein [Roseinatronobacter sp. NSM]|uniref:hypothetical protein n=1 Tax=Roseinatronobacter sp. NSM TaxID=3457785 RepID=UPI00403705DE